MKIVNYLLNFSEVMGSKRLCFYEQCNDHLLKP